MGKNKSQKQQKQQQQEQQLEKLFIGGDAADHAISTYGNMNDQRAVSEHNNAIAMSSASVNKLGGADLDLVKMGESMQVEGLTKVSGGAKRNKSAKKGGKSQTKEQLQQLINKQLKKLKIGGALPPLAPADYNKVEGAVSVETMPVTIGKHGGAQQDLLTLFKQTGKKFSKQQLKDVEEHLEHFNQQQQQQQGGVGLNEVLAPVILLYASQVYGKGKTAKNPSEKKFRKSLRKVHMMN